MGVVLLFDEFRHILHRVSGRIRLLLDPKEQIGPIEALDELRRSNEAQALNDVCSYLFIGIQPQRRVQTGWVSVTARRAFRD